MAIRFTLEQIVEAGEDVLQEYGPLTTYHYGALTTTDDSRPLDFVGLILAKAGVPLDRIADWGNNRNSNQELVPGVAVNETEFLTEGAAALLVRLDRLQWDTDNNWSDAWDKAKDGNS
jgi:hypothetical protein